MIRRSGQKALSASHFNGAALRQRVDDDDDDQHRAGNGVVVGGRQADEDQQSADGGHDNRADGRADHVAQAAGERNAAEHTGRDGGHLVAVSGHGHHLTVLGGEHKAAQTREQAAEHIRQNLRAQHGDADQVRAARVVADRDEILALSGLRQRQMRNRNQHHRNRIVERHAREHGLVAVAGNRAAEVFNRASAGHDVDQAANHAVRAEGENQRRHAEIRNADAVDQTDGRARRQTQQQHLQDASVLLGDETRHTGGQTEGRADGNVDLARHNDERNADGQQRVHRRRVKAGNDVVVGQKSGGRDAGDDKQRDQKDQAGHPPGFEQVLHFPHTFLSCAMPKEALVRASCVISSRLNSPLIRPWNTVTARSASSTTSSMSEETISTATPASLSWRMML